MPRSIFHVLALCLVAPAAHAEGFAVSDLRSLDIDYAALPGTFAQGEAGPNRLSLLCTDCDALSAIDILLGRQEDGTEGRVRSGETTIAQLEATCQAQNATCRIEGVSVGPAIGWVSVWESGVSASTTVLFRDGDLLTIRSVAGDRETARQNGEIARNLLAPGIVGN